MRINSIVNDVFGHRLASEKTVAFHAQLPTKYPALFTIPGEKFTLQEGEVAPLHETLARENEWLKEKFGKGYYDDEVSVGSDQSLLDDAAREFLKKHFVAAGPRIKKIIEEYLATH
ncbi:MAG: hypothetical protein Q8L60_03520 [Gammaproteobacteria bacterium]|nr:hypothetical protein [Gammaproteobacteria bacterium]MDP2139648.1 hypothetical protein [Gammaproteobacteria bacterium]MDP2348852.1 hypothetical protein [Gammaproteobacteria bacterium]